MTLVKRPQIVWQPPPSQRPPVVLTQEMYEDVKAALVRAYPKQAVRNLLMLGIMRGCGLRRSEVLRIRAMDVQREQGRLFMWVTRSKRGRNSRPQMDKVFLPDLLGAQLEAYIKGMGILGGTPVIQITGRMVGKIFEKVSREMGYHVHAHQNRHLYYSWLRDNGLTATTAARMIGDSERVAERYYLDAISDERKAAIQARVPV